MELGVAWRELPPDAREGWPLVVPMAGGREQHEGGTEARFQGAA